MASSNDVRNKIAELMDTLPDIGVVHTYERYAKANSDLRELYEYDNHLRGWFIRRVRVKRDSQITGITHVITSWQIRGYLSLNDENQTEKTLDDLVDLMMTLFQSKEDLDGLVSDISGDGNQHGLQMDDSGPVMFSGVLSHGVRLTLMTKHEE